MRCPKCGKWMFLTKYPNGRVIFYCSKDAGGCGHEVIVKEAEMREETRAEYERFLDRLEELQAKRVNVDVILQIASGHIPDSEKELILRMKRMSGQEVPSGGERCQEAQEGVGEGAEEPQG